MSDDQVQGTTLDPSRLEEVLSDVSLEQYLAVICTAWRGGLPSQTVDARDTAVAIGGNDRLRRALTIFLASSLPACAVHEAASIEAAAVEGQPDPDLIVLAGVETPREIEVLVREAHAVWPRTTAVVLGIEADRPSVAAALRNRARGYIPLTSKASVAMQALQLIRAGGVYAPASAFLAEPATPAEDDWNGDVQRGPADDIMDSLPAPRSGVPGFDTAISEIPLSPRQAQIIELVRQGLPNKVIAHLVGIQESTVKVHIRSIMRKLNASNRTAVAVYATRIHSAGLRQ